MSKKAPLSDRDINRYFRANTGVVIVNSKGLVMAFERSDRPGAWQFPQGGIDPGEDPAETAPRELREETGIIAEEALHFLGELPEWVGYELPEHLRSNRTGRGQVQRWFFYRVRDDAMEVDLAAAADDEFKDWRWMTMADLIDRVIAFRKPVYRRLAEWLADNLPTR